MVHHILTRRLATDPKINLTDVELKPIACSDLRNFGIVQFLENYLRHIKTVTQRGFATETAESGRESRSFWSKMGKFAITGE